MEQILILAFSNALETYDAKNDKNLTSMISARKGPHSPLDLNIGDGYMLMLISTKIRLVTDRFFTFNYVKNLIFGEYGLAIAEKYKLKYGANTDLCHMSCSYVDARVKYLKLTA